MTDMAMSDAIQRNAVSEGFALGLTMEGMDTLSYENYHMTSVDLSLAYAWRHWPHRTTFPKVDADFRNRRTEHLIVAHATQRRHTQVFYWDRYDIITRGQWDWPSEFEEAAKFIDGEVSAEGWRTLAEMFLTRLQDSSATPHLGQ